MELENVLLLLSEAGSLVTAQITSLENKNHQSIWTADSPANFAFRGWKVQCLLKDQTGFLFNWLLITF